MVRLKTSILPVLGLLLIVPVFAGMPSRLHEFAQVADGGNQTLWMRTSFLIVNQNLYEIADVTLRFYDDNGNPTSFRINGTNTAAYSFTVPPEGMVKLTTAGQGTDPALKVGSATLRADVEVGAQAFFEIYSGNTLITQASIEPMGPMSSVDLFVDYDVRGGVATAPRTGYAMANLSTSTPVDVGIWLYAEDGSDPIWSTWFQLPARGHTARYLDEYFPALTHFRGTARIKAGGSITLTALQAKGLIIGTLPPIRRPLYSRFGGQ